MFVFHIDATQNQKYDRQTLEIMRKIINNNSNCIDVGCHSGEVLDAILDLAPDGQHYAFEPIPFLHESLSKKYSNKPVLVSPYALKEEKGKASYYVVRNALLYSGFRQRQYDVSIPEIEEIIVLTEALDNIVPMNVNIDFIKIDVAGAEYNVIRGAMALLQRCKPILIFKFGMGAADYYETKPEMVYYLLVKDCDMKLNTLRGWLNGSPEFSFERFCDLYDNNLEFNFIAYK